MSLTVPHGRSAPHLIGVQVLRGIAALLVVVFHAAAIAREHLGLGADRVSGPWDQGYAGVDLFFVISGFIMVWVAGEREAGHRTALRFLFDRVTRIYPLWWVFCAVMAAYFWVSYGQPASPLVADSDRALGFLAASLALWPQGEFPVLQLGWTLVFEMGFYLVFAALLLLPVRWRGVALLVWGAVVLTRLAVGPSAPAMPGSIPALLVHPLVLEFLLGAAAAFAVRRWRNTTDEGWARFIAGVGIVGLVLGFTLGLDVTDTDFPAARVLVFGVPAACLVAGLVKAEEGGTRTPKALAALGDASYSLYLSHFIVLLAIKRVLAGLGLLTTPNALAFAIFVLFGTVVSLAIGVLTYSAVERRLLKASRSLWPRARPDLTS